MKAFFSFIVIIFFIQITVSGQEHNHDAGRKDSTKIDVEKKDSTEVKPHDHSSHMPGMKGMDSMADMDMPMPGMNHSYSLNLPMNRNGSGTAWLPDETPMYGLMFHSSKWMYMLHGNVSLRYTRQDIFKAGTRGGDKFGAPNWFMFMGQRKVGKNGLFHFSSMISLDRLTEGGAGYPLLFQTGESWKNQPLVDRQHPHDLVSELSVAYTYAFSKKADLTIYAAYPGEPSIGSVAFMHRMSAFENPDAPLSHHWNDGTHITFGVATLGFRYDKVKLEVSSFTGREPNENRYSFDKPLFDSKSARISYNPNSNWALQVSQAWVKSPEVLHDEEDVNRTTASAIYSKKLGAEKFLNATILWGLNKTDGHDGENAVLTEASYRVKKVAVYGRYEWVQKSVEELDLNESAYSPHAVFPVNALTVGLNYDLMNIKKFKLAVGGQLTGYKADSRLDNLYGNNPISGQIFLRIYPKLM